MMLFAALAILAIIALGVVILPIVRTGRAVAERAQFDRAVYRDQLEELERDVARGVLSTHEAVSARLEIERRLLATDAAPQAAPVRTGRSPLLAGILAAGTFLGALVAYVVLGAPGLPDLPFASRNSDSSIANAAHGAVDIAKVTSALSDKLKADPNNFDGWMLLARSELSLGDWKAAADAYRHAVALRPDDADSATGYGEMLVLVAGGTVTPEAHDLFAHALARAPDDDVAEFYLALAEAQAGRIDAAIAGWLKLAGEEPADSDLRAEAARRIAEAAKLAGIPAPPLPLPAAGTDAAAPSAPSTAAAPSAALAPPAAAGGPPSGDAAAAIAQMPEAQRNELIRGMVAQLAQKLEAQPNDPDGWVRLGRSYLVLGDKDKAASAYDHAAQLKPKDVSVPLQEIDALLAGQPQDEAFPPRVMTLLRRVEAIDPNQPDALWYLGLAAARAQQTDEARGYWQHLLPLLPAGSDESKKVTLALQGLPAK